jgi:hypothetical protein
MAMKISEEELLERLRRAYEMEEVMAGLLTALAAPHVLTSNIPERDRLKVHKMLTIIHADTLEHQKIVSGMIKRLTGGSRGV